MRTAVTWGDQPTDLFYPHGTAGLSKPQLKIWNYLVRNLNKKMKLAYQIVQDETCSLCGTPSWYGRNEDNNLAFEEKSSTCKSCRELGRKEEERREGNKKHQHGVTYYTVPVVRVQGTKLPTRDQWLNKVSTLADLPEFSGKNNGGQVK